ncbi:MAG TPA: chemotaxis protein CheW [Atopostipes sp.]|nr:chemotaxis protein CheW [Atopostipes sp.]
MQILIFRLKDYHFGILTENVIEIMKKNVVKSIPNSPEWVEGLINLRGEVLTLVNMYSLLKMDDFNLDDCYNNTVIVNLDENSIALMVDEIIGVTDINENDLQSASENDNSFVGSLITIDDRIINVLELKSLFEETEG